MLNSEKFVVMRETCLSNPRERPWLTAYTLSAEFSYRLAQGAAFVAVILAFIATVLWI